MHTTQFIQRNYADCDYNHSHAQSASAWKQKKEYVEEWQGTTNIEKIVQRWKREKCERMIEWMPFIWYAIHLNAYYIAIVGE